MAEETKSGCETMFDNIRYAFSTVLTGAAIFVIVYSLGKTYAALPGHPALHFPLLVGVLTLLAYLEGLQVAILALERVDRKTFVERKRAFACHRLATANRGRNVQRFLVGRQFFVVFVVFLCAQLTTYKKLQQDLGAFPHLLFVVLIETGLPGALVVLAFGQLMPQLIAATHPITFMNLPGSWSVIQLCLSFESIGVTHFSWVLADFVKFLFRMDEKENIKSPNDQKRNPNNEGKIGGSNDHKIGGSGTYLTNEQKGNYEFDKAISPENITIKSGLLDAEKLFTCAENGLSNCSSSDLSNHQTQNWLKDDAIKKIYGAGKSDSLPMPPRIVRHLVQNGKSVPRYLLPPFHPQHIPPHIVCYELLRREQCRLSNQSVHVNMDRVYDNHVHDQTQHTA